MLSGEEDGLEDDPEKTDGAFTGKATLGQNVY